MPAKEEIIYVYIGKDKQGKERKGEETAKSEAAVKKILRGKNITPIRVKPKPYDWMAVLSSKPVEPKDIALFARQMATMMQSGVALLDSFDLVAGGHENPNFVKLVKSIKAYVEAGGTMADALREHPQHFDSLFCNLVFAGEQAGILESLLTKLADYKEKSESMKKKIKGALSYPISIMVIAG
ncbi:MAG: type II secretion system F family protein, partial [Proteobacteria bacterium]|nr:type II secretion system F family protein [Pseudomonadota bacterium]